jgi:sugar O-acyltransferase (sialic acid O-acetyltransferase NeuD family)
MTTTIERPMFKAIVRMPRLNANEDEAKIAEILVAENQGFAATEKLFSLETTKASIDVEAPCAGTVVTMLVKEGDFLAVGMPLCHLLLADPENPGGLDIEWVESFEARQENIATGEARISTKARMRALALGVDWTCIVTDSGMVRVKDVEDYHAMTGATTAAITSPVLPSRFDALDAIIFGGGGHARAVVDAAQGSGYRFIGAVDARLAAGTPLLGNLQVLGGEALLQDLFDRGLRTAFVGVGGATSSRARAAVFERLSTIGFRLPSLVARSAHLGIDSRLGEATYLFPGANVGPAVQIGCNCIINQNVVIAHDSVIGNHVHLAPNAVVAGQCRVGPMSTIGMCATVMNGVTVGSDCLVHNNVALTQDVADGAVMTAHGALPPRQTGG